MTCSLRLLLILLRDLLYITNMSKAKIRKRKTHELRLTKFELLHLRDLMSILLPPDAKQTLSQAMATLENRQMVESVLWRKVSELCSVAGLPTGNEAPDYVVAPISAPPMGVFQLAHDPMQESDITSDDEDEDDDDRLFKGHNKEEELCLTEWAKCFTWFLQSKPLCIQCKWLRR